MKISFLLHTAYGIGGTISTTFNLAAALAERNEVEVVSTFRNRESPLLTLDPRVRLRALVDTRHEQDHPLHSRSAKVYPPAEGLYEKYSELTDERIGAFLEALDSDVVVGTRPGLNVHLAAQAPARLVRIAQEHVTLDGHRSALRAVLRRNYPRLDAVTTVTERDAAAYKRKMRLPGVHVESLPNSVPDPALPPAYAGADDAGRRVVIAAGRLVPVKRYDLLVKAFARVVRQHPDWQLRIYGRGEEHDRLRRLIDELGVYNDVFLMGTATPMEAEWVKGSIAASTSDIEPFGMTLVEAMRCGLPVVSTDCPHGPREIIEDGADGRLVPVGRADAFADALLELIQNEELRRRMSRTALENSRRFGPEHVVARAEGLFETLVTAKAAGRPAPPPPERSRGQALLSGSYAARDTAMEAADTVLRKLWKATR